MDANIVWKEADETYNKFIEVIKKARNMGDDLDETQKKDLKSALAILKIKI